MFYFHGSPKKNLDIILKEGLKTRYGRATLTTNPLMTLAYGETKFIEAPENIQNAMMLVITGEKNDIHLAKDSNISYNSKKKTIEGWVNRYKNMQFGYFPKIKKDIVFIPVSRIIAIFGFTPNLVDEFKKLKRQIRSGQLTREQQIKFNIRLNEILSDRITQISPPKINLTIIIKSMVEGMIGNIALLEIRKINLYRYVLNGWNIVNYGDHPVNLFNSKDDAKNTLENIGNIINAQLIPSDIVQEYRQVAKSWI